MTGGQPALNAFQARLTYTTPAASQKEYCEENIRGILKGL